MEDEWDDDYRDYIQSFDPDSDCGCEDGIGNGVINEMDPQYMEFLGNLRQHGNSYVFQSAVGNGRHITVYYEPDDGPVEEGNPVDVVDTLINYPSSTKTQKHRRSLNKARRQTDGLSDDGPVEECNPIDVVDTLINRPSSTKTRKRTRSLNMASRETDGLSNSHQQRELSMVDLSYQTFLGALSRDADEMMLMSRINELAYDQNREGTSDSEVMVLEGDPMSNAVDAPIVVVLDDDGTVQNESSQFREGLMEVLQKPYSKREYVRLNMEVRHQRQVEQKRELRSGPKVFLTAFKAKSYLELHPDLETQIVSAKQNKPRILNLLRGFFYWLQHMTSNARFKPWLDASCLAVQPPKK